MFCCHQHFRRCPRQTIPVSSHVLNDSQSLYSLLSLLSTTFKNIPSCPWIQIRWTKITFLHLVSHTLKYHQSHCNVRTYICKRSSSEEDGSFYHVLLCKLSLSLSRHHVIMRLVVWEIFSLWSQTTEEKQKTLEVTKKVVPSHDSFGLQGMIFSCTQLAAAFFFKIRPDGKVSNHSSCLEQQNKSLKFKAD